MSDVLLRDASIDDLEAILALETSTFTDDAWSRESMRAEIASPHTRYLVAEAGGSIVGYAGVLAPSGAGDADIQTIAVAERARRAGIGRALMLALMDAAREQGALAVFLEVRADNPAAQDLYTSLGFERIGVRPRYYQPGNVDALVMRASLNATANREPA